MNTTGTALSIPTGVRHDQRPAAGQTISSPRDITIKKAIVPR